MRFAVILCPLCVCLLHFSFKSTPSANFHLYPFLFPLLDRQTDHQPDPGHNRIKFESTENRETWYASKSVGRMVGGVGRAFLQWSPWFMIRLSSVAVDIILPYRFNRIKTLFFSLHHSYGCIAIAVLVTTSMLRSSYNQTMARMQKWVGR